MFFYLSIVASYCYFSLKDFYYNVLMNKDKHQQKDQLETYYDRLLRWIVIL